MMILKESREQVQLEAFQACQNKSYLNFPDLPEEVRCINLWSVWSCVLMWQAAARWPARSELPTTNITKRLSSRLSKRYNEELTLSTFWNSFYLKRKKMIINCIENNWKGCQYVDPSNLKTGFLRLSKINKKHVSLHVSTTKK